jgi:flagellum-specific ATP synthase
MRSLLDGHIVLSRSLANQGHYPSIDVLQSVSRLLPDLTSVAEQQWVRVAVSCLAVHEKNREMIDMGVYRAGSNAQIDRAIQVAPDLHKLLVQTVDAPARRADAMKVLGALFQGAPT